MRLQLHELTTKGEGDFDKDERRRRILLRNAVLVFVGYCLTQLATLAAHLLGLSSVRYGEILFVTGFTLASSAFFHVATRFRKTISRAYVQLFHFGQYVIWLAMYAVWVLTLREIRVMALFFAMMPLAFMLADTKVAQSLAIAVSAFLIQIVASHFAITHLGQPGVFAREVFLSFCFAPAALFLCHLSGLFARQRQEVAAAKHTAEQSRDALAIEVERTQQANDELAKAMAKINELARVDPLTGLFNRRHLMEALDAARKRHARSRLPFSIVLADIDFFKRINDTHGHLQGDAVLRGVAAALQRTLREIDVCARYGGEEFMLVLEQTDVEQALACAERLRGIVQREAFEGFDAGFSVTVSLGVAQYGEGESLEQCIARADAALYRAKHEGRNRVSAAEAATAQQPRSALA